MTCDLYVAANESTLSSLKHCQYQILLITDKIMNDLFRKLQCFCVNFQPVDCSHTFPFTDSTETGLVKLEKNFDIVETFVSLNKLNKGADILPNVCKKKLLCKKLRKHMLTSVHRTMSSQAGGSVWVERTEASE